MRENSNEVGRGSREAGSEDAIQLLREWKRRLREAQFCHYEATVRLVRFNYWLGVPVVICTTIVGTAVFASLEQSPDVGVRISVGLISILSAVLASLQTFLSFTERAEKHRSVAARYGIVRREVEELLALREPTLNPGRIESIRSKIDQLAVDAPGIPDVIAESAHRKMTKVGGRFASLDADES